MHRELVSKNMIKIGLNNITRHFALYLCIYLYKFIQIDQEFR